jgi:bifunctional DNA-binding transcriptional regulator/antitoxin component of YhaV-PrlF toxin-antitoxin module
MKSWTITLEEADDGSGDLVLPLPQDLMDDAGWKEGDKLEWIDNKDGTWSLKKLEVTDEQRI